MKELEEELAKVRDGLAAQETKVGELQRRLDHRQTEAHVLKNSMNQYKHQVSRKRACKVIESDGQNFELYSDFSPYSFIFRLPI